MDPVATCDLLLSYLKLSNLNFHLAESPFSAYIEIRKTFIMDKSGSYKTSCLPASIIDEKKVIEANQEAQIKGILSWSTNFLYVKGLILLTSETYFFYPNPRYLFPPN